MPRRPALSEDARRRINITICYLAWAGALILTMWVIADVHHRPYGTGVVLLIGIGVTASLTRSRYKLAQTITEVFQAGVRAGWNMPNRRYFTTKDGEEVELKEIGPEAPPE